MNFTYTAAKDLKPGDKLQSSTGKILVVSKLIKKENRTIVLFDGDLEIDFVPHTQLKVLTQNAPARSTIR